MAFGSNCKYNVIFVLENPTYILRIYSMVSTDVRLHTPFLPKQLHATGYYVL